MTHSSPWRRTTPAPPVRMVHLGLGAFHKAHQAWFTDHANAAGTPAQAWGIAAFTGRRPDAAEALTRQDGLFTLVTRGPQDDTAETVASIVAPHAGDDGARWRGHLADPQVGVVTLTVTERGYRPGADGGLDLADADVAADLGLLRGATVEPPAHPAARTAPGRVVDGLRARLEAGGAPVAVVSCDNLPDNGAVLRRVTLELADAVDPALARWVEASVSFVSTMVDRITPATTAEDRATVRALTGRERNAERSIAATDRSLGIGAISNALGRG